MALAIEGTKGQRLSVIERLARLLHARVWAADAHRAMVACCDPNASECGFTAHPLPADSTSGAVLTLAAPLALMAQGVATVTVEQLDAEPISPHLTQALLELLANQTMPQVSVTDQHELKNYFIYNLLFDTSLDEEFLIRQGQVLGIDLTIPRAAILIDATDYIIASSQEESATCSNHHADMGPSELEEVRMRRRVRHVINSIVDFFHLPSDTICAYVGGGEIVALKASGANDLVAWGDPPHEQSGDDPAPPWAGLQTLKRAGAALLARIRLDTGTDVSLGIGRYHPGVRGLERSYQDARAALSLGRRFHGENQLYCLDSLGIAAFIGLSDERTKVDLARRLLGPLDHEPELIETMLSFFATGCSPSLTSSQLCIHRNTLNYRLEKVASLTGLDPRRFDDAVQIRLALLLRSLHP